MAPSADPGALFEVDDTDELLDPGRPNPLVRTVLATSVGIAVTAVTWGVGELVASMNHRWQSPFISVGNRVVDGVPERIKSLAISAFGTNDKVALITGTVMILAGLAIWAAARVIRWDWRQSIGFVAALAAIGSASATFGREGTASGFVPTLVAASCALALYWVTDKILTPRPPGLLTVVAGDPRAVDYPAVTPDRRRMLVGGALGVAVASTGLTVLAKNRRTNSAATKARRQLALPVPDTSLPTAPSDPAAKIAGLTPLFVPTEDFYRIDTALAIPQIDVSTWKLTVDGLVESPTSFTYDDIVNRPLFESDITISCVSNEVGGDLVGNARWLGCRLDDLLDEAGIRLAADQIVGWSVDGWSGGFPVEVLDGRDAMVAIGMNGDLLNAEHGFPARLIIPGVYGYVSATKWLDRIELTTFADFSGFWIPRGWAAKAPVKVQSRIDRPRPGGSISAGDYQIAGVAWAPIDGIAKVEVQVGKGPWMNATLGPDVGAAAWRQWGVTWDATPGEHTVRVRATNGKGETQTSEEARPDPDGATGWHTVSFGVSK